MSSKLCGTRKDLGIPREQHILLGEREEKGRGSFDEGTWPARQGPSSSASLFGGRGRADALLSFLGAAPPTHPLLARTSPVLPRTLETVFRFAKHEDLRRMVNAMKIALLLDRVRDALASSGNTSLDGGSIPPRVASDVAATFRVSTRGRSQNTRASSWVS